MLCAAILLCSMALGKGTAEAARQLFYLLLLLKRLRAFELFFVLGFNFVIGEYSSTREEKSLERRL